MKLTLIRHGETEENVQRIIQGQAPGHLTDLGRQQARELAGELKGRSFDAIYCSDLQRCLDTAEPIRREFPDTPFFTDALLRERDCGSSTGQSLALFDTFRQRGDWYLGAFRPPGGGESWLDIRRRQTGFLNKLLAAYPNGSVLVVTHRGPLSVMHVIFEGKTFQQADTEDIPNASIWEVVVSEPIHE